MDYLIHDNPQDKHGSVDPMNNHQQGHWRLLISSCLYNVTSCYIHKNYTHVIYIYRDKHQSLSIYLSIYIYIYCIYIIMYAYIYIYIHIIYSPVMMKYIPSYPPSSFFRRHLQPGTRGSFGGTGGGFGSGSLASVRSSDWMGHLLEVRHHDWGYMDILYIIICM